MKKRLVSLLLAFSMMLTFLPVGAVTVFAADSEWSCGATDSDTVTARFESASGTLTFSGKGAMANYQTMHFVAPWKEISNQIKKIVIENGVTSIGSNAFYQCSDMQATLDLSDAKALTSIGNNAFYGCKKLTGSLEIPDSVTKIGAEAFRDCNNLSGNFELPEGLQSVGNDAFCNCYNLTGGLKLPDTVISIGTGAFYNCAKLDGYLVLSSSLTKIPQNAFNNCVNLKVEDKLVIPSSVTVIEEGAFARCSSLTGDLEIPDTVTSIGNNAFNGCSSLDGYLTLPSQLTVIPSCAFWNCSQLKVQGGLKIPENVKSIGWGAFRGCAQLKGSLTLPEDIESIGRQAFYDCTGLTGTFKIPDTVTKIEQETFYHCGLDFIFPSNVTSIGLRAFDACVNFKGDEEGNFMIPETVQTVGEDAFKRAGIKRLFLPQNLQNIQQIDEQNRAIYYNGTRAELEEAIGTNNFTNLDRAKLKIGSQDIRYLCNVTFNPNGGVFADGTSAPKTIEGIYRTEKVATKGEVPTVAARKGYRFDGWYYIDEATGLNKDFAPAAEGVPDTMVLYAAWRQVETLATVSISGLNENDMLVKGEEYPFTVTVEPNGDLGEGTLTLALAEGGTLYCQTDEGWEEVPADGFEIQLERKSYSFKLVPDTTGPNTLTAGVQKKYVGGGPSTADVNFTVAEQQSLILVNGVLNSVTMPGAGDDAEPKDITAAVKEKANEDGSLNVPVGAQVSVSFDQDAFADSGLKFGYWNISGLTEEEAAKYTSQESFAFTMPAKGVKLEGMTKDASIDDGDNPLGAAAAVTVGVVGSALLAYQLHELGTEFWLNYHLPNWAVIPQNRIQLAEVMWQDAGCPEPESDALYEDIAEDDSDAQKAARWAVENQLMDLPDDDKPAEFVPYDAVSRVDAIRAWKKYQELKENVQ